MMTTPTTGLVIKNDTESPPLRSILKTEAPSPAEDESETNSVSTPGQLRSSHIKKLFTGDFTIVIDEATILQQASEDTKDTVPRFFKSSKEVFEEILKTPRQHTSLIQLIDSKRKDKDVLFCCIASHEIYSPEAKVITHIYYNWSKFWDSDLHSWDNEGTQTTATQKKSKQGPVRRNVHFPTNTYTNKVFVTIESLTNLDVQLPQLISMFETGTSRDQISIGVMGTPVTAKAKIQKIMSKTKFPELLQQHLVYYKNATQYKKIMDTLCITHVVDTKQGYIRKVLVDGHIFRECFIIESKHKIAKTDYHIHHVADMTNALEQMASTLSISRDESTMGTPQQRFPEMIEQFTHAPQQEGQTTHEVQGGSKKFIIWNMNSIRSVNVKNFLADFLLTCDADLIGITELKASAADTLTIKNIRSILHTAGYHYRYFNTNKNSPGQHGTALFSRIVPDEIIKDFGGCSNTEGRLLSAVFKDFIFVLTYTPTLGRDETGQLTGTDRRDEYDLQMLRHLQTLRTKYLRPIVVAGDLNTCIAEHHTSEQALFESNHPSFTSAERQGVFQIMQEHGLLVAYDQLPHEEYQQPYTFFLSQSIRNTEQRRPNAPPIGMKIDHFLVPQEWFNEDTNTPSVTHIDVLRNQQGSDHLPVTMTVNFPDSYTFHEARKKVKQLRALMQRLCTSKHTSRQTSA